MNKQETIVYGGAFNPPTTAHRAILQAAVDRAERMSADVWLLPSGDRTDKTIDVDLETRIRLCSALCNDVLSRTVHLAVDTSELHSTIAVETYDTVQRMNETYPDRAFTWVFGSDSVQTMPSWQNGEWLLDNLSMLVIERPGSPVQKLGRFASSLPVDAGDVSSTMVRQLMSEQRDFESLVAPSVYRELKTP